MGRLRVGTSGWNYRHWRERFYPEGMGQARWLAYYAERLPTVEVNATFYRLPTRKSVERWVGDTPDGFMFAVKASRYLTHIRRLQAPKTGLDRLSGPLRPMSGKLGPLLVQLPPNFNIDLKRLDRFLAACDDYPAVALEPRDPSWWSPEVEEILRQHKAAMVWNDYGGKESPRWDTADFVYIRRHGVGRRYGGKYGRRRLRRLADQLTELSGDVWCFFNNDAEAAAPADALDLLDIAGD